MSTPDPNIRISNSEREAVLRRLQDATAEGRLELDEFTERSEQVYRAKTYAEVERLLVDLPEESGAVALRPKPKQAAPDLQMAPKHAHVKREGVWTVPTRITLKPKHSHITLDMRHAEFNGPEVAVEANLTHSRLTVILPKGASAMDDGIDFRGGSLKNRSRGSGDGVQVRLSGLNKYSAIVVRYERRFWRWRW